MRTLKSLKRLLFTLLPILMVINCDKSDDSLTEKQGNAPVGILNIKTSLQDEIATNLSEKDLTLKQILLEASVTIHDSSGNEILNEGYLGLPKDIILPVGKYRLFIKRTGDDRPNFNKPTYVNAAYHSGGEALVINNNSKTVVNTTMVSDHVRIVIDFSDKVLQTYPNIIVDIIDSYSGDTGSGAQKLRWSISENGKSGYLYIDEPGTDLEVSLQAIDGTTGQELFLKKTFTDVYKGQKYRFSIELNEHSATAPLISNRIILPKNLIIRKVPFSRNRFSCFNSGLSDYEILKKLAEANPDPGYEGGNFFGWDLTDTSMQSWSHIILDSEGRLTDLWLVNVKGRNTIKLVPEFGQLCHLKKLVLGGFGAEISEVIGQLSNLESLRLIDGTMETLPPEIGMLKKLKVLYVNKGLIRFIPPDIGRLSDLESLSLVNLAIGETLPAEIGLLSNLKWLNLSSSSNPNLVPPEIGNLSNLEELIAGYCHLENIPKEVGLLSNLKILVLNGNYLTKIPREFAQLSNIEIMGLRYNPVAKIPKKICDLEDLDTDILLDDGSDINYPADICWQEYREKF